VTRPLLLVSLAVALGCSRSGYDSDPIPVIAAFPAHADWNAYVQRADGPLLAIPDVDCDRATDDCVHAGVVRRYDVPGVTSCDGLLAQDDLNAFVWACDDTSGHAVVYSVTLRADVRLVDLLSGAGFALNAVTVQRTGTPIARSSSTRWWSNPVRALPPDEPTGTLSTTLDEPYAIYVATRTATRGVRIAADGISIVVPRDATLSLASGTAPSCTPISGPPPGTRCIVQIDAHDFAWVEGYLDGANEQGIAVAINDGHFTRLRNLQTQRGRYGVVMTNAHVVDMTHVRGGALSRYGFIIHSSQHVKLVDTTLSNVGVNNGAAAILIENGASDITIAQSVIDGARPYGVLVSGLDASLDQGITIAFATIISGDAEAIAAQSAKGVTVAQTLIGNRGGGLQYAAGSTGSVAQVAVTSSDIGFDLSGDGTATFAPFIMTGANGNDCPGTCTFVTPGVISDVSADAGFVGATSATKDFSNVLAWIDDSAFRTWNRDASYPDATLRTGCNTGTCRLFDWRIAGGGVAFRSATGHPGTQTFGGDCPTMTAVEDTHGNQFLVDALERLDDGIGDDDGLCEAGEACIYAPHIGAYLGEGELTAPCLYDDTTVPGVTLQAFTQPLAQP